MVEALGLLPDGRDDLLLPAQEPSRRYATARGTSGFNLRTFVGSLGVALPDGRGAHHTVLEDVDLHVPRGRLVVLLGAAQWGLHEAFLLTSAVAACGPVAGNFHSTHSGASTACLVPSVLEAGPAMLAGHVLAVLVTALVIARAEAALWLALQWLRPLLGLVRPAPLPAAVRALLPAADHPVLVWRRLRRDRVRGPPAATVPRSDHRV